MYSYIITARLLLAFCSPSLRWILYGSCAAHHCYRTFPIISRVVFLLEADVSYLHKSSKFTVHVEWTVHFNHLFAVYSVHHIKIEYTKLTISLPVQASCDNILQALNRRPMHFSDGPSLLKVSLASGPDQHSPEEQQAKGKEVRELRIHPPSCT